MEVTYEEKAHEYQSTQYSIVFLNVCMAFYVRDSNTQSILLIVGTQAETLSPFFTVKKYTFLPCHFLWESANRQGW